jgi:hypothetical protein
MNRVLSALVATLVSSLAVLAQDNQSSQYDRGTPPQHGAGVTAIGSYISADIGTINLSNGSLNFKLAMGNVGGRGFWLPLSLNYSSKLWSGSRGTVHIPEPLPGGHDDPVVWAAYNQGGNDLFSSVAPGWTVGGAPLLKLRGVGIGSGHNSQTGCTNFTRERPLIPPAPNTTSTPG